MPTRSANSEIRSPVIFARDADKTKRRLTIAKYDAVIPVRQAGVAAASPTNAVTIVRSARAWAALVGTMTCLDR